MTNKLVQELIDKTYRELATPKQPVQRSRMWRSPSGYIFLVAWSNASLLRIFIRKFTIALPKKEFRLKTQTDDAGRSTVANIEEGFARPSTKEYLDFLGFSFASLKEVKGDIQRCLQDGFIKSVPGTSLSGIGIDLTDWHEALKKYVISQPVREAKGSYRNLEEVRSKNPSSKIPQNPAGVKGFYRNLEEVKGKNHSSKILQNPLNSFKFLYPPVDNLQASDLTYEIFIELINKTDWHLRKLVESLEKKQSAGWRR